MMVMSTVVAMVAGVCLSQLTTTTLAAQLTQQHLVAIILFWVAILVVLAAEAQVEPPVRYHFS